MQLNDLNNGDVVRLRMGRAGRERVEWGNWVEMPLYIQASVVYGITLLTVDGGCWAEAGASDLECIDYSDPQGGIIMVEDYYLQIAGLSS